jgi:hypothetical protein
VCVEKKEEVKVSVKEEVLDSPLKRHNEDENIEEEMNNAREIKENNNQRHGPRDRQYEGGEGLERGTQEALAGNEVLDSNVTIDTNLFLDERKEIIEDISYFNRFLGMLLVIGINGAFIIYVISVFISQG